MFVVGRRSGTGVRKEHASFEFYAKEGSIWALLGAGPNERQRERSHGEAPTFSANIYKCI